MEDLQELGILMEGINCLVYSILIPQEILKVQERWSRKKSQIRQHSKKIQMQGAIIFRNETYLRYVGMTKDESQRSPSTLLWVVSLSNGRWTFYEAVKIKDRKDLMLP